MNRTRSRDLLVVAVVAVLVSLPGVPLVLEAEKPCGSRGIGECLGPAVLAGLYALAAPVLFWVGLLIGRVRRHFWVALTATMLALVVATLVGGAVSLVVGQAPVWPFVVPVAVFSAVAAAAAVQRTARAWIVPAGMAVGLAALWVVTWFVSSIQDERRLVEELDTFQGQLYAPQLPGAEPTDVWTSSYPEGPAVRYDSGDGSGIVGHLLALEPAGMCATMFEYGRDECVERGDTVRFDSTSGRHTVALLRGETVLTAEWSDEPDPDAVLEALREAGAVSPQELAALD